MYRPTDGAAFAPNMTISAAMKERAKKLLGPYVTQVTPRRKSISSKHAVYAEDLEAQKEVTRLNAILHGLCNNGDAHGLCTISTDITALLGKVKSLF
jgi:hypothetical protein